MKLNKLIFVGAIFSSLYMIGCSSKFETKVKKAGNAVPAGASVSASNTAGAAGNSSGTGNVPAASATTATNSCANITSGSDQCATTLSVIPSEVYLSAANAEFDMTYKLYGYYELDSVPQAFNMILSGSQVQTQTAMAYGASSIRNVKVTAQCVEVGADSDCTAAVLAVQTMLTDSACVDQNVQLGIYKSKDQTYAYTFVGNDLSFDEIKAQVIPDQF